ncbi:MAG: efflux RND transporter periplasmic adaptor subunit [Deltaproteobacteria bacterium]|nr:efflux RND transporter periplasmic adaptor subunit [Deltaproteobacteria bacterium]
MPKAPSILAIALTVCVCAAACKPSGDASASGTGTATKGGQSGGPGGRKGPQAFSVETHTVQERQLEYTLDALGTVVAFEEAQITARVAGTLEGLSFAEGDTITTDRVLAHIEPRRYRIAVEAARASIQRTQAALDDARATLKRSKQMGPEVATGAEIDVAAARVRMAEAELAQSRAGLELAELNLADAKVRSPVPGIVQSKKAQTGQYAQPGAVLATVLRTDPLRLKFAVAEPDATRLAKGMHLRFRLRGRSESHRAAIVHLSGKADEATRMVEVLADIAGDSAGLRPGAFAEVLVPIGAPRPAPVVPQTAIRPTEKGFVAFVVQPGDPPKAKERILQLGMRTADNLVEVQSGLQVGEQVVVVGAEALRDGAQVRVVPNKLGAADKDRAGSAEANLGPAAAATPAQGDRPRRRAPDPAP